MTQFKSAKFAAPKMMTNDGCAVFINDSLAIAIAPVVSDTYDFLLPKGFELSYLRILATDMDTGTPALAFSIGYAPVASGGPTADTTYFKAAGAIGQAAGGFDCDFIPIAFEEDMYLRLTCTTIAATFAVGTVRATMGGNMVGVR